MRKHFLLLTVPALVFYAGVFIDNATALANDTHDLVIYHTNDVQGHAFEERDQDGKLIRIGYDRLKALVDGDATPNKLLLDAGDVLLGHSYSTARRGELVAEILSLVGYDAIAAGDQDFSYGSNRLHELSSKYRLPFLSANIVHQNSRKLLPAMTVRSFGDLKVGIFGLTTPETKISTNFINVAWLEVIDPVIEAKAVVERLQSEGVDVIVGVMHMGSMPYCNPMAQTVAEQVPGIDIVIDGHSHSTTVITVERSDGSRAIVTSAGSDFENVGKVTVDRDDKGKFSISATVLEASSPEVSGTDPDPAMRAAMNVLKSDLETEMNKVVMTVPFDMDGAIENVRQTSTNLGRLICAAIAHVAGSDIAFLNGGAIRESILQGPVTKGKILTSLPYVDFVYLTRVTGEELTAAVAHGLGLSGSGGFPQFWGMEVETETRETTAPDGTKGEMRVPKSVTVGGKPLDPKATYSVAINNFLYFGGDGYTMFGKQPYKDFGLVNDVFTKYLAEHDSETLRSVAETVVLR
ncbi:MAG: bifunctional metallophosphatase/5'-nucleotidase [Deltaproteobacteria bacterium]|jgi:2',3'-cyclic-nucleotide 2'-phosphodiesterase (5'-nucleotidase family)|nr:bifunctional metallophosphatase/5'-nucleotidase [Deltaproteobacteria bacterium]